MGGKDGIPGENPTNDPSSIDWRDYKTVTNEYVATSLYSIYFEDKDVDLPENRDLLSLCAGQGEAEIALGGCLNSPKITLLDKRNISAEDPETVKRVQGDFISYLDNEDGNKYGFMTFFGAEYLLENMTLEDLLKRCSKKLDNKGFVLINLIPYEWKPLDLTNLYEMGYRDISFPSPVKGDHLILQKISDEI